MLLAIQNPEVVWDYLVRECMEGRIIGPLPLSDFPRIHISRFGVIPKSSPGKWRLIVDLSAPEGHSVNDGVREDLCSLKYVTVDDAAQAVLELGPGAQLAKVDVRSAYRIIPVHAKDRWLLGMAWDGALYVDTTLPFGLSSAPKLFNAVADTIEWIIYQQGVNPVFHYLDDGAPRLRAMCCPLVSGTHSVCPTWHTNRSRKSRGSVDNSNIPGD